MDRMLRAALAACLLLAVLFDSIQIPHVQAATATVEAHDHHARDPAPSDAVHAHWTFHGQQHDLGEHDHSFELVDPAMPPAGSIPASVTPLGVLPPACAPPLFEIVEPPRA